MIEYKRGDTFIFPFSFKDTSLFFEVGDLIRFGAKKACDCEEYILYKEIPIEEKTPEIQIIFEPEETRKIQPGDYIVELELTKNNIVETPYEDKLIVKGDIVSNGNNT